MKDGEHRIYVIKHRLARKSKWRELDEDEPVKEKESWADSSHDFFGRAFNPWAGKGKNWAPVNKEASDELHRNWCVTGIRGWSTLSFAQEAVERVRAADAQGKYDSRDQYRRDDVLQIRRHEFRIVLLEFTKKTTVIEEE